MRVSRTPLPEPSPAAGSDDRRGLGIKDFWSVYAEAKYTGRDLRGPRDLTDKPGDLPGLAELLVDLCECAWRSGIRSEQLAAAARTVLADRRRQAREVKHAPGDLGR